MRTRRIILSVSALSAVGGVEKQVTSLALGLASHGIDTMLLVSDPLCPLNQYVPMLRKGGVRLVSACFWAQDAARLLALVAWPVSWPMRALFRRRFPAPAAEGAFHSPESTFLWTFKWCMRKYGFGVAMLLACWLFRPGVVHFFAIVRPLVWAMRTCRWLGIPVVAGETGEAVATLSEYVPETVKSMQQADAVHATCPTMGRNAGVLFGCPEKIRVFRLVLPEMPPVAVASSDGIVRLGFAGRVAEEKNLDGLLHALARLPACCRNWHLTVAGDGPELDACRALAVDLGLAEKVEFLGRYEGHSGFVRFVEQTDVFVLPSKTEGFPVVLVEVAAAGRPVIGTPVGGVPEIVQDAKTGFMAAACDPESLAEAIRRALANADRLPEMGMAAREFYEREFLPDKILNDMIGFYDELAQRRGRGRKARFRGR